MYRWLSVYEGSQLIAENISASADTVPIIGHDLCYPVCEEAGSWEYMEVAPWLEKSRQWDKWILTNSASFAKIIGVIVGHKKPSPPLLWRGRCKAIACTLKMRLNAKSQQRHSTI